MGLRLDHIDAASARGHLDGYPFHLKAADGRFAAEIGAEGAQFRAEGDMAVAAAISHVRQTVYQVIARYRNQQRLPAF